MKLFAILTSATLVGGTIAFQAINKTAPSNATAKNTAFMQYVPKVFSGSSTSSVTDVVTNALAFKALLTTTQQSTLQQAYTTTLARKWSNLPCGSGCRNGIQFSTLTSTQLAAAKTVVQSALSTAGNNIFSQILLADDYLNANGGGSGYGSGIYFISYLNTPSTTGTWMLQVGGHHMAFNIAYNNGVVVGTTPVMLGVEPTSFTVSGTTYTPLTAKHDAMANLFASLTSTQLSTAKLSTTFSDCLLSPGESNGNTNTFPATKQGLICSGLTTAQKTLLTAAMAEWVNDMDATAAATLMDTYNNGINSTYVAYTGSGTSGTANTFLNANTNYVRIDGPRVWIELVCQSGVVFPAQIHYHSVWRDHTKDYGTDLTSTTLPVSLTNFAAALVNGKRTISWTTSEETNVNHFDIEYSATGNSFSKIGTAAATNNGSVKTYSFIDNISTAGAISYYRLKTVNDDGTGTYSSIVSIKNRSSKDISVYPNPAKDQISVTTIDLLKNATIRIIDNYGRIAISSTNNAGSKIDVNIAKLAPGPYFVQVEENGSVYSSLFVKQ